MNVHFSSKNQEWETPNDIFNKLNEIFMFNLDVCASDDNYIVCLVPSRTDTKWWHNYAMKGQIVFIKGRLKFGGSLNNAPFPSALVVFGDYSEDIANIYKIVNER